MNWSYIHNEGEASATIVDPDGYTVAHICATQNTTAHEDLPETLNLMCAAPDLLEALQMMIEDLELRASLAGDPGVLDISCGVLFRANKAIEKAKGESYE